MTTRRKNTGQDRCLPALPDWLEQTPGSCMLSLCTEVTSFHMSSSTVYNLYTEHSIHLSTRDCGARKCWSPAGVHAAVSSPWIHFICLQWGLFCSWLCSCFRFDHVHHFYKGWTYTFFILFYWSLSVCFCAFFVYLLLFFSFLAVPSHCVLCILTTIAKTIQLLASLLFHLFDLSNCPCAGTPKTQSSSSTIPNLKRRLVSTSLRAAPTMPGTLTMRRTRISSGPPPTLHRCHRARTPHLHRTR